MKLLCKLGFHKWAVVQRWIPSFTAQIVTEVWDDKECLRCGLKESIKWFDWEEFKKEDL